MINTAWSSWRTHGQLDKYTRTSPNLIELRNYARTRGWQYLGGRVVRAVRGGTAASIHSWGAAIDIRHPDASERRAFIEWLIEYSHELHVSEIHDYAGVGFCGPTGTGGYWRAGRGWKAAAKPSGDPHMHKAYALWIHVETTIAGWGDATPIDDRAGVLLIGETPAPDSPAPDSPAPDSPAPAPNLWDVVKYTQPADRPWVGHPNVQGDDFEIGSVRTEHWLQYFREVMVHRAGQTVGAYGSPWSLMDIAALRAFAAYLQVPGASDLLHVDDRVWQTIKDVFEK